MSAIVKPPKYTTITTRRSNLAAIPAPRSRYEKQQRAQLHVVPPATPPATPSTTPARSRGQAVRFPNVRSLPAWLTWLSTVQRGSTLLTFSLVTSVLGVYSWTVYAQDSFGREYRRLEHYQELERRLTPAIESLKDWLATQAESPDSGLVVPNAASTIVLEPAPQRPSHAVATTAPVLPSPLSQPIGY